ncbi:MAG TPA: MMPL family transporter [Actinomycetota bacterium]
MRINPESLARASSRRPWTVVAIWVLIVAAMGAASQAWLSDVLTTDIDFTNEPESKQALLAIERNVTGDQADTEFFIVRSDGLTVDDPAFEAQVREVQAAAAALGDEVVAPPAEGRPTSVLTVYDVRAAAEAATDEREAAALEEQAAGLVSQNGRGTLVLVPLVDAELETVDALKTVLEETRADGFEVLLAGPATLNADTTEIAEEDLRKGEGIGLGFALIVLVVVFGALLAAVLPIAIALAAIPIALGGVALLGTVFGLDFSIFTTNMASMIGLAVGIDYSLFIVARYREERRKGFDPHGAIVASGATASRAVFFSGLTVVLALLGMFIMPTTIFRSMATGAMLVVLASMAASLTLLPALLALFRDRINWPRIGRRARAEGDPDPRGGFWDRWTRTVMRAPVVSLVLAVAVLGSLTAVYFTIDKGTSQSAASLPDEVESKRAFLALSEDFAAGGRTDPVEVYVEGDLASPEVQAAVESLRAGIADDGAFAPQAPVTTSQVGNASALAVAAIPAGDAFAQETFDAIDRLREDVVPAAFEGTDATVLVGGMPAIFRDFVRQTDDYQPIVLAFVLGLSFLLLMTVFRSIVVPLKAVVMNLLSVGAAYGAIVLVFQHGVGIGFFNAIGFQFQQVEAIEAWLPLMLFSILFGLSMDYHVFLLSRIREEYDKTGDNTESVAYGLRTTASIITGAAIIMVAVFTAFASGRLTMLQQMGFGLAVAVFMDATIVRSVLVPASMKLLGDRNWYLPHWLEWLPKLNVEGHEPDLVQVPDTPAELVEAANEPER